MFLLLSSLSIKIFHITKVPKSQKKKKQPLAKVAKTPRYKSDYKPHCTERKKIKLYPTPVFKTQAVCIWLFPC